MPVTDEEVIAQRLDREMLERPHLWQLDQLGNPLIFVKRGRQQGAWDETGPCRYLDGGYYVTAVVWASNTTVTPSYFTVEEMLADGWVVD